MKNHSKIDTKSTRNETNSQDEGQVGQEGHQDRKKRARNENLRLRTDFEPTSNPHMLGILALLGG